LEIGLFDDHQSGVLSMTVRTMNITNARWKERSFERSFEKLSSIISAVDFPIPDAALQRANATISRKNFE